MLLAKYTSLWIYNAAGSFHSKANEFPHSKMQRHNPGCYFKKNGSRQKSECAIAVFLQGEDKEFKRNIQTLI